MTKVRGGPSSLFVPTINYLYHQIRNARPDPRTALSGATSVQLTPQADHAATVMDVTPFKNFWTAGYRISVTAGLVEDVREETAGVV